MAMNEELWKAISKNNLQKVQKILSSGSNIDLNKPFLALIYDQGLGRQEVGNYLLQACLFSSPVVVSALVKAGADVNHSGVVICASTHAGCDVYVKKYNATPLILAVIHRNVELVEKLLHRCGADINGRNDEGLSALHLTVKPAHSFTLHKYGQVKSSSVRLESSLESLQREQIASLLLAAGARVDLQDYMGRTPLHIAAMERDVQMCRILTDDTGVDSSTLVNLAARDGTTPLHAAILAMPSQSHMLHTNIDDCTAVVTILIRKGANLAAEKDHLNPLHLAAEHGLINVIKLLVEAGADIHAETPNTGLSPLDMAEHRQKQDVIDYLTARQKSEREKSKQEEPGSVEQEEEEELQESDTLDSVEGIEFLEGAVGGLEQDSEVLQLLIKEEGKRSDNFVCNMGPYKTIYQT